jgi:hypothetical protein
MKKLSAILVVTVLALLMQLRVAYACEQSGHWPAEHCTAHGLLIDAHAGEPGDRDDDCDISIELAARNGRSCVDLAAQLDPADYRLQAILPPMLVELATAPAVPPPTAPWSAREPVPPTGGTRTWLGTSRLRL